MPWHTAAPCHYRALQHSGSSPPSAAARCRHPHKLQFWLAKAGNKRKYTLPCGPSWKCASHSSFQKPAGKNQEVQTTNDHQHSPRRAGSKSSFSSGLWCNSGQKVWQNRALPCQAFVTAVSPLHPHDTKLTQTLFQKERTKCQVLNCDIFHFIRWNGFTSEVCGFSCEP